MLPMLIAIGAAAAFLTTEPWATLLAGGAVYIVSLPVGFLRYRRLRRAAEALRNPPHELAPPQSDVATAPRAERG